MDPEINLPDLTEDLEYNIDDLTTALEPLLTNPLSTLTTTLPLLDKAKLNVLTAYTLESLLFSALQASGTNAKEHRIFPELARLKAYFGKIKTAENVGEKPTSKLDKEAAARFIRHGLAGNERYDKERAERIAKEKARAALKARLIHKKFDDEAESKIQEELSRKRKAEEEARREESDSEEEVETKADKDNGEEEVKIKAEKNDGEEVDNDNEAAADSESAYFYGDANVDDTMDIDEPARQKQEPTTLTHNSAHQKPRKSRKRKHTDTASTPGPSPPKDADADADTNPRLPKDRPARPSKAERKAFKRAKKLSEAAAAAAATSSDQPEASEDALPNLNPGIKKEEDEDTWSTPKKSKRARKHKEKEVIIPEKQAGAPRAHSATFNALLAGNLAEMKKDKEKSNKKGKKK